MVNIQLVVPTVSLVCLLIIALATSTSAQYPKWLHGATGFVRATQLQRRLNVSLVIYFYTDHCANCRTLDEQTRNQCQLKREKFATSTRCFQTCAR
jgi:hypothetical protein